jgi:aspartyl-tRNA(Asn)/glutamyl-tRNA(Gln) amidotransferase subunit A
MTKAHTEIDAPRTCLRFAGVLGGSNLSSIEEVAAAFDRGVSPVGVIEACLERITARNGAYKAMIAVDSAGALAAAKQAETDLRAGNRRSPLHGIPVVVKDMIDVAGWPTTGGSRLLGEGLAPSDAVCVARLKAAGAIILGKTNLHELTTGGHDNPWFGKVVNPLDGSRGTGGSSSGSVAAVAAGFCVAAVGTDTGGSNRSPAAATGLFGFKPSFGLIESAGTLPTARSLDIIGPITSTVRDARLMTESLSGRRASAATDRSMREIVVATCPDLYAAAVDPIVSRSHANWLDRLGRSGVRIIELAFADAEAMRLAGITILKFEFAQHYGALITRNPDHVGSGARAFAEASMAVTRASYESALATRAEIKTRFAASMDGIDVVAVPVVPGLAPRLSDETTRVGDTMVSYGAAGANFRLWANVLDMPALAMPLGCEEALPASIQIAARTGNDWTLLDVAETLSRATA